MCERRHRMAGVQASVGVLLLLLAAARTTLSVPTHFTESERYRYSVDLDAEQTEARYDQGMLSDIINDNDRGALQKAESCLVDNYKYDHGQKIQRLDPCEICLCIDGEIFCWWKQCDPQSKASQDFDLDSSADSGALLDHPAVGLSAELSTMVSTGNVANATNDGSNGATRLVLADTLTDGGTTSVFSSTVAISTPSSHAGDSALLVESGSVRNHGLVGGGGAGGHLQEALEGIPKNILSFPQSPPIMMYRPAIGPSSSSSSTTHEGKLESSDGAVGVRSKSKGKGGHKKVKSGGELHKKTSKQRPTGGPSRKGGSYASFDVDRKPTVSIASDALPRKVEPVSFRSDPAPEEPAPVEPQTKVETETEPEQFGGYGFGMIHEPESAHGATAPRDRDVPQHYIITSSGHVEMFDDSGTIGGPEVGTENHEDVLSFAGRVSSPMAQDGRAGGMDSTGDSDSNGSESDETDEGPGVGPAIMLTTNVTQGRYSSSSSSSSSSRPGSTLSPAPPSSVIDILNTTTALETDYGEGTNHSELIYPEVPVENGPVGSSSTSTTTTRSPTQGGTAESVTKDEPHCVVLGVTYPVGAEVKKVGLCMYCVCEAGPEYDSSPRVSCTRLNCPPLILPDMLDEAGY